MSELSCIDVLNKSLMDYQAGLIGAVELVSVFDRQAAEGFPDDIPEIYEDLHVELAIYVPGNTHQDDCYIGDDELMGVVVDFMRQLGLKMI